MRRKMCCILLILGIMFLLGGCGFSFLKDLYPQEQLLELTKDTDMDHIEEVTIPGEDISPKDTSKGDASEESSIEEESPSDLVFVHVCGCVKRPGLYHFRKGERVDAAIEAAGGFSKEANGQSVNLAEFLMDGEQIVVASLKEENTQSSDTSGKSDQEQKININVADKEKLMSLNGIGEGKALSIISYRQEHGSFSRVEDIKNVNGIGETIYEKIKNMITVK